MALDHIDDALTKELKNLTAHLWWRKWMRRIKAVLFIFATAVSSEDLACMVGQAGCSGTVDRGSHRQPEGAVTSK